jgi:hypothetical protein
MRRRLESTPTEVTSDPIRSYEKRAEQVDAAEPVSCMEQIEAVLQESKYTEILVEDENQEQDNNALDRVVPALEALLEAQMDATAGSVPNNSIRHMVDELCDLASDVGMLDEMIQHLIGLLVEVEDTTGDVVAHSISESTYNFEVSHKVRQSPHFDTCMTVLLMMCFESSSTLPGYAASSLRAKEQTTISRCSGHVLEQISGALDALFDQHTAEELNLQPGVRWLAHCHDRITHDLAVAEADEMPVYSGDRVV